MRADRLGAIQAEITTGFDPHGAQVAGSKSGRGSGLRGMLSSGPAEQVEEPFFRLPEFSSEDREIEQVDEESTSVVRTIIRGLGGFVWVIILIGFTLARSCGED